MRRAGLDDVAANDILLDILEGAGDLLGVDVGPLGREAAEDALP